MWADDERVEDVEAEMISGGMKKRFREVEAEMVYDGVMVSEMGREEVYDMYCIKTT